MKSGQVTHGGSDAQLGVGDSYRLHFVWKLPDYDYIRAIYAVTVRSVDTYEERYVVTLDALVGGRQERPDGSMRPQEEITQELWQRVIGFVGNKVRVPYESTDGRPLHMRYPTLIGEHNFFEREL